MYPKPRKEQNCCTVTQLAHGSVMFERNKSKLIALGAQKHTSNQGGILATILAVIQSRLLNQNWQVHCNSADYTPKSEKCKWCTKKSSKSCNFFLR